MSKKRLMYGADSDAGWKPCNVYNESNIDNEIVCALESTKKLTSRLPKVSVPSPFARFELVQKAFSNLAKLRDKADTRDKILVSQSLDVMQLVYEHHADIKVKTWSKRVQIQNLISKDAPNGHKLYGKTLELYMRQENYGFNEGDYYRSGDRESNDVVLQIIIYNGNPVGCTSPTSVFMATPNFNDFQYKLSIEGRNDLFFCKTRSSLFSREAGFVEYVYRTAMYIKKLLGAKRLSETPLKAWFSYLEEEKKANMDHLLSEQLHNFDDVETEELMELYQESEFSVLGVPLFQMAEGDLEKGIDQQSDFVIQPTLAINKVPIPLVLTNNKITSSWRYLPNVDWEESKHRIDYEKARSDKEYRAKLPGTDIEYQWLYEDDFLSNVLVQLPYKLDNDKFYVMEGSTGSYLLPIRKQFFEYFDHQYLMAKNGRTSNITVKEKKGKVKGKEGITSVTVSLSIPVKGGRISLRKIYKYNENETPETVLRTYPAADSNCVVGSLLELPVALAIYPFARMEVPEQNVYMTQLIHSGIISGEDYSVEIDAYNHAGQVPCEQCFDRNAETKLCSWSKNHIDYFLVRIMERVNGNSAQSRAEMALIPLWKEKKSGNKSYRFSFDFGTTNSHIAVLDEDENQIKECAIEKMVGCTMSQLNSQEGQQKETFYAVMIRNYMKQEFLPFTIGKEYTFPVRTVLSVAKTFNLDIATPQALLHTNLPFIYGKEDYNANNNLLKTNLKWQRNGGVGQNLANAFIEELLLLARGYCIEHDGNLQKASIVWTYPLSMNGATVNMFDNEWNTFFQKYFHQKEGQVYKMTESIAPYLYYRDNGKAFNQMTLSVDIGGGTCDVLIFKDDEHIRVTSFRFAADVIFGAGKAEDNPMIKKYSKEFQKMFSDESVEQKYKDVRKMLDKCFSDNRELPAAEANSVLFSLETHPLLKQLPEKDKSYNVRLSLDDEYKIVFIYFYAAIIYYLVKVLQYNDYPKPARLLFSGTGSKLLNIITRSKKNLSELTTLLIETFWGEQYGNKEDELTVEIEEKEPKQLTAKGALCRQQSTQAMAKDFEKPSQIKENTLVYSIIPSANHPSYLKYGDLQNERVKDRVLEQVKEFHIAFLKLKKQFIEDYGCNEETFKRINTLLSKGLKAYLDTEISDNHTVDEGNKDKIFEDVLFFYPIKGVIQHNLIKNIANEEKQ